LQFRTDVVQDVHPRVLLDSEDQPLAFLHVERTGVFDLDPWHELFLL
jgi:mannose-6-phosphate isomerase